MNRFPPVAWAAITALATASLLTAVPEWWPAGAAASLALLARRRLLSLLASVVCVMALAVSVQLPAHTLPADAVGSHRFTAVLTSAPTFDADPNAPERRHAHRVDARITSIDDRPCSVDATLIGRIGDSAGWGDQLSAAGNFRAEAPGNARGVLVLGVEPSSLVPARGLLAIANTLRDRFRDAARLVPGLGGELVPGLAIGDTSRVSAPLIQAMRTSSLTHLMAVSGANCAVVVALVWAACAALGASRRWRVVAALIALAGFALLVTPQPSVLRASVMAAITLWGVSRGARGNAVAVLSITVIALLALNPWLAWNLGFILSVAATAGLVCWARPLTSALTPRLGRHALLVAVPLAAHLSCAPILIFVQPNVSVWALPANIIAGWCAPAATVLGLAACLTLPFLPWLGAVLLWGSALFAAIIGHVAVVSSRFPGANIPWLPGALGVALALVCVAAVVVGFHARSRTLRRLVRSCAVACVCVSLGAATIAPLVRAAAVPSNWVIAGCNVGQGDAFLLRSGASTALIDTGPDPTLLTACLDTLGVSHLELLILTHYDRDHVGGVPAIIGRVTTALVGPVGDEHDERIRKQLQSSGAAVRDAHRGDTAVLGATPLTVLWPDGSTQPGNDSSIVLTAELDGVRAVFLGDLGADAQDGLLRAGMPANIDVVKVAHHGSADQSPDVYQQLGARLGLIGVGHNGYGHPTARLLDLLQRIGTEAVRTDTAGMELVAPGENRALRLWTEHPAQTANRLSETERSFDGWRRSETNRPRLESDSPRIGRTDFRPQWLSRRPVNQTIARFSALRRPFPRNKRPRRIGVHPGAALDRGESITVW